MYDASPVSKDTVSVTEDKKGKRPTSVLSVDIDEALNDGHSLELVSEIQFCAIAAGRLVASSAHTTMAALECDIFCRCDDRPGRTSEQSTSNCDFEVVRASI